MKNKKMYGIRAFACMLFLVALIFVCAYEAKAATLRGQNIELAGSCYSNEYVVVDTELNIEGCPFVFKKDIDRSCGLFCDVEGCKEFPDKIYGRLYVPASCKRLYLSGKSTVNYVESRPWYKYNSTVFEFSQLQDTLLKTSENGQSVSWSYTLEGSYQCYAWSSTTGECVMERFAFPQYGLQPFVGYVKPMGNQVITLPPEIKLSPDTEQMAAANVFKFNGIQHVENLNSPELRGCPGDNPYTAFDSG